MLVEATEVRDMLAPVQFYLVPPSIMAKRISVLKLATIKQTDRLMKTIIKRKEKKGARKKRRKDVTEVISVPVA